MHPYRFPRSQGSLDLTDPNLPTASSSASLSPLEMQQPRPSFVITNATPQDEIPQSGSEQQHLARMTSATRTLLAQPHSSPSSQHLSIGNFATGGGGTGVGGPGGKTLSRISEYSESAYSADGSSRPNSHEPEARSQGSGGLTPSASTSTNESSQNGTTPTTMSFSFPAPPAHSSPPAPTGPLPQIPWSRETVVSPSPWAYPALPGSPSRSHLPSRPITALTTPIPTSNPSPLPVPISNFAPHSRMNEGRPSDETSSTMIQIPGRVVTTDPRASYHQSQPSDSTLAWTTDGKYSTDKASYAAYDAVSIAPSLSSQGSRGGGAGGESNHRFTLDNNEKSPSRLGNVLPIKRGANRTLLWVLAILAVIGVAVGTGLGVGLKNLKKEQDPNSNDGVVGVDSSPSSSQASKSVLLPTATSASVDSTSPASSSSQSGGPAIALISAEAFSTTFGYRIGSKTTVVPLSYTIPTSYFTREDGRIQFTEEVVLPSLDGQGGSFTSDLRFRVPEPETTSQTRAPQLTSTASSQLVKRDLQSERKHDIRRWERLEKKQPSDQLHHHGTRRNHQHRHRGREIR